MYLSQYGLKEKPFQISTDPRFLWLGEKQREAFATLQYGILYKDGHVLVTGDVGTGKTTLANALVNSVGEKAITAKLADPSLENSDFFKTLLNAYGMGEDHTSKGAFLANFSDFLHDSFANDQKVVLIIDEAQRLNNALLEELLHLSNIEVDGTRVFNIVFVGQNEFNDILLEDSNRALRQRITINYNLDQLTENETKEYILHRLKVAGSRGELFSSEAIHEIYSFSEGIPRLINIICDHALLSGYLEDAKTIESDIIRKCEEQVLLPSEKLFTEEKKQDTFQEIKHQSERIIDDGMGERNEIAALKRKGLKPVWRRRVAIVFFALSLALFGFIYFLYIPHETQYDSKLKESKEQVNEASSTAAKEDTVQASNSEDIPIVEKTVLKEFTDVLNASTEREKILDETGKKARSDENLEMTSGASPTKDSQQAFAGDEQESPDPAEVIDWLLETHAGKQ